MTSRPKHHQKHAVIYPVSFGQRIYSMLVMPTVVLVLMILVLLIFGQAPKSQFIQDLSINTLMLAVGATFVRLSIAFVMAVIVAVPLAVLATFNQRTERIFLPLFDIIESVPILAFFPVFILFFVRFNFLNGAAIFIIFLGMLWNIVFTVVGGLKVIPQDIKSAAKVFGITGLRNFFTVTLPSVVPHLVTGSILAFAQGWNIIIVAEVLHVYIPGGTTIQDLFGIGSILVQAASTGQNAIFIAAVVVMVVAIALINFFVWQKLLHYAERFRFE